MRICVAMPGHDYSTQDVHRGLVHGLKALGHHVIEYDTGLRVDMAGWAMHELWRHGRREDKPSMASTLYEAGRGIYADVVEQGIDAVIIMTTLMWHPQHTKNLRKAGMPVGIVHTEAPYMDASLAENMSYADIVWPNERTSVKRLLDYWAWKDRKPVVKYLAHAYHPERHTPEGQPGAPEVPAHDVVFVGTGFRERIALLEAVDWRGIDFGLYGHWGLLRAPRWLALSPQRPEFPDRLRLWALRQMARMRSPGVSPLWEHYRGGVVPNATSAAMYKAAKIGLNLFRGSELFRPDAQMVAGSESANIRCYELAACGAFFLSDHRDELAELFGNSVPTFDTPDDLAQGIRFYLAHPGLRAQMAGEALAAVRPHDYVARAAQVVDDLRAVLYRNGTVGASAPYTQEATA